jgi:hypothetical protein
LAEWLVAASAEESGLEMASLVVWASALPWVLASVKV